MHLSFFANRARLIFTPARIAIDVGIDIHSIFESNRVSAYPSAQPLSEEARVVITQAALLVPFHACIPVALRWDFNVAVSRAIRTGAVRVIFLVRNDFRSLIGLNRR